MYLSERLLKIAEDIDCVCLADIGTDHGYIPIYSVENGNCKRAIACDINEGPLKAAMENIAEKGLSEKIETRLSNGLEKLKPNEADTIVIAGMGGFLIRDILEAGKDKIGEHTSLLLQPMVAPSELREYLIRNGYNIYKEKLAREGEKFYNILLVKKGTCTYSEKEILFGRGLEEDKNYADYMNFHKGVLTKIIEGLKKSSNKDDEIIKYQHILNLI